MTITGILAVTPMTVGVNEPIHLKVKILTLPYEVPFSGFHFSKYAGNDSPFSINVGRKMHYLDNVPAEWTGTLRVDGGDMLDGPKTLCFDGHNQGSFPGDTRPIRQVGGWRWTKPGIHWITLTDVATGITTRSNPVIVTEDPPDHRIYWGDIHWQTFFTDGLRCPEELYSFARDEAFLDFGAITDHAEGLTDRQWDYFVSVTNDFNVPDVFATLVGLEWTSFKFGHRNIYYRGDHGPLLRATDAGSNTLPGLWDSLKGHQAIAIPHHSANVTMGVDWSLGYNSTYEKAVEIYSVWGNSENSADDGNPHPIRSVGGEKKGQHVVDALKRGYRFGFVGSGDIHDGRPGDDLHSLQPTEGYSLLYPQGLMATCVTDLTRKNIFDAIGARTTYATTRSRIFLDVQLGSTGMGGVISLPGQSTSRLPLRVTCAAAEPITEVIAVVNGEDRVRMESSAIPEIVNGEQLINDLAPGDFCYVRVTTRAGNMAWSSPIWLT